MTPAHGLRQPGQGRAPASPQAWTRTTRAMLMLLGMASLSTAWAAGPDVASLEREVAALKDAVQHLQARVDRLEGRPAFAEPSASGTPPSAPRRASDALVQATAALQPGVDAPAASAQAQLRINWSKIRQGIDADEVSRLLGTPTSRLRLDGRTAWYYSYPAVGNGSVFFTDAGRVSSHQSPFGWGG